MKTKYETKLPKANNKFDLLSQGFGGGYFYGLEYILEDFFKGTKAKPDVPSPSQPNIDWFGLNG